MKRRAFLASCGVAALVPILHYTHPRNQDTPELAVVKNGEPAQMARKAVETLGGMGRFISSGDIVVVKPNMSWDRVPEQAATTNPEIVSEVIRMCFEAGARKVKVFDRTLNEPQRCYQRSGIEAAAKAAGADVFHVHERLFKMTRFPEGELINSWELYKDVLEADKLINLPCAKHHAAPGARVSLGMKNLMGFLGGNRGTFHRQFEIKIADLSGVIKPDLIILDAFRLLQRNGPSGGSLADVIMPRVVAAGCDPVAVDSFGVTLFGFEPEKVPFLKTAHERGLGEIKLDGIHLKTITLS